MTDKTLFRNHYLIFIVGGLSVIVFLALSKKTIEYTSTDEFCAVCYAHPHADATSLLSAHNSNRTGVSAKCVDFHLPPEDQGAYFLYRKAYHDF